MKFESKERRLRERMRLALPVRVRCRETAGHEWEEVSRLMDVTPFGARFAISRPTERGRLLQLTVPLPRQLRCFDHVEDQYRVWALVRHVRVHLPQPARPGTPAAGLRFEVGAAFTGKHPPPSYLADPATRYDVAATAAENGMYVLREVDEGGPKQRRSQDTRLHMALGVTVEVFDERGQVQASEQTVTENVSRRGAAVWTTLKVERGRFVRVTSADRGFSVIAAVRAHRAGQDGIPRLHLEFIDRQWPLEGVE